MYSLHLILKEENTDNILEMMGNISEESLTSILKCLYGNPPKDRWATKFLEGIKNSDYFSFRDFMKVFK